MTKSSTPFRFDLLARPKAVNKETGEVLYEMFPDPRRYDWVTHNGEKMLYDKFDKSLYPESVVTKMLTAQVQNVPFHYQPPLIDSPQEYIQSRVDKIRELLVDNQPKPTFEDKSDDFLKSLSVKEMQFVIMSVDLVGSTKLSQKSNEDYLRIIPPYLHELSNVIPQYRGHVLKYTGDGVLAYFPEPSMNSKHDLAFDCSVVIQALVKNAINPCFKEVGLPEIKLRVGLESGRAHIMVVGSTATKQQNDLLGQVLNIAVKVQGKAEPDGIAMGQACIQGLYIERRMQCEEISLPEDWPYTLENGKPYPVHRHLG